MTRRRRDHRIWYAVIGVFVMVFSFTFLAQNYNKIDNDVEAASLKNFDPGNIISDYQMSNYKSMNESQIQSFLKSKNSCKNTNLNQSLAGSKVSYYSEKYPPYTWHVAGGHFVCMADEKIKSETAAHIIYKAAQDYRINPRVLIVLLQKEQSLVTDTLPNSFQYRSATGYGCPDTAACSTKYYGFKNQVRNAASLFRTVLDGGWTNYPVGKNYIQYNPNKSCGGSVVNIKNRATSALYRYTPYQPNKAALAAGYGTATCGAYGNRNFYLFFQDWFGGITSSDGYSWVDTPRYMVTKKATYYVNPKTNAKLTAVKKDKAMKYTMKVKTKNGEWCIRTEADSNNGTNRCILRDDLEEMRYVPLDQIRYMVVKNDTNYINSQTLEKGSVVRSGVVERFVTKNLNKNQEWCLRTKADTEKNIDRCIVRKNLDETSNYVAVVSPRYMRVIKNTTYINPHTLEKGSTVKIGTKIKIASKVLDKNNAWCIRTDSDTKAENNRCIPRKLLGEATEYVPSVTPRKMKVKKNTTYINPHTLEKGSSVKKGQTFVFTTKILTVNNEWCIRTKEDSLNNNNRCILRRDLGEV